MGQIKNVGIVNVEVCGKNCVQKQRACRAEKVAKPFFFVSYAFALYARVEDLVFKYICHFCFLLFKLHNCK
jgi:hypothetical protein